MVYFVIIVFLICVVAQRNQKYENGNVTYMCIAYAVNVVPLGCLDILVYTAVGKKAQNVL